jgi:hypothetical protein
MADRLLRAPPQSTPNVVLPAITFGSGSVFAAANVPVAQLVNLSNGSNPPTLSLFSATPSMHYQSRCPTNPIARQSSSFLMAETPLRSSNPFVGSTTEQTWSQADALLRTSRDRALASGNSVRTFRSSLIKVDSKSCRHGHRSKLRALHFRNLIILKASSYNRLPVQTRFCKLPHTRRK